MAKPFLHTPQDPSGDKIRLLVLLPAPLDAPIRCRLETVPLSSAPKYDILTHLWGANKSKATALNDTPIPVSEPILAALRRLRPPSGSPRSIWIDAVCLDQRDRCGTEHQQQQQRWRILPRVYAEARQLCVRMGRVVGREGRWNLWGSLPRLGCADAAAPVFLFRKRFLGSAYCIFVVGQHEWTWEAPGRLRWGGDVGEGVRPEAMDFLRLYHSIHALRQKWSDGKRDLNPYGLLYEFRWLECEDPRDRIYGFLNLAPRILEAGMVPDYSTPIKRGTHIRRFRPQDDNDTAGPSTSSTTPRPRYGAAKLLPAQPQPHPDPHTLVLHGIRFDAVAALGTPWHPERDQPPPASRTEIAALEQWEALALTTPVACPDPYGGDRDRDGDGGGDGGGGRRAALWRTYIGDFAGERSAPAEHAVVLERWYGPAAGGAAAAGNMAETAVSEQRQQHRAPLRNPFRDLRDYAVERFKRAGAVGPGAGPGCVGQYARRVRAVCGHRRLLVSKRGYMGLAPWHAEVRDVVAVLHGGSTPFLLRPGAVPGVYSLVGECFVYGIMNGEALSWENAAAAARDFRIA
ncbi:predicted protein [Chaetomium globosum CBS 148.51]|uniref:Heterokaryon incompatibility domain-containing protein n=1 Tax=Chaetomium globosum (strain ATCC 6205 / CBS 148.51 / DSM 1962 / NBRC 6347 / NRRL 1970) TaxID=306901 RepID=Q2H5F7_CHAGB|nr:uncharacterized protein CHGG_06108 [Chaetomium globosum CBS 148.51]EAQ89489.1 predicted protein [Chaetomium globosum CBS 148.51]